tara:strand:- start:4471 stop:5379 length:909 start_codon:yes stop_codon:yes gene_type:complete
MAKRLVKSENVFRVADEIRDRGELPTALNIYDELGHGSLTTITKFLKEWLAKEENKQAENLPAEIKVPSNLMDQSSKWIKTLWFSAKAEAEQDFEEMRNLNQTEVNKALELLKESEAFSERQNLKLLAAQTEIEGQAEQLVFANNSVKNNIETIENLKKNCNDLLLETSVLKAEAVKDETLIAELKQSEQLLSNQNISLNKIVESKDRENRKLAKEKASLEGNVDKLSLQVQELLRKMDVLNNEKNMQSTEKSSLVARLESTEKQLSRTEKKNSRIEEKNEKLQEEILEIARLRVIDTKIST